jgi:hypothetical protein
MGRRREQRSRVAIEVLPNGPGDWMMVKEKKPRIRSSRYWKSYIVQRWDWSDRRVSTGENEVCSVEMEEVGDMRLRSFERILRRIRCGTSI